jgi:non-ribosomal peptide synthetase component F
VSARVPAAASRRVGELAQQLGCSRMMVLLAGYAAALNRLTGQTDICIQTSMRQRRHRAVERMIGVLLNPVIMRIDVSGDPPLGALAQRVAPIVLEAIEHSEVSVLDWAPHRYRRLNFNYVPMTDGAAQAPEEIVPGLHATPFAVPTGDMKTPFDLHLWLFEGEREISLHLLANQELFRPRTCAHLLREYVELLGAARG